MMSGSLEKMSKEKETDAANVLSQMSQLVGSVACDVFGNPPASLSSSSHDDLLEADSIGATCTLQPSNLDIPVFGPGEISSFPGGGPGDADTCIAFDDSEHTYAAHSFDSTGGVSLLTDGCLPAMWQKREEIFPRILGIQAATCRFCSKTFKRAYNLKIHLRSHSGERPHPCSYCGVAFRTSSDLKRHIRVHVADKEELPKFPCPHCDRVFSEQASLKRHSRCHSATATTFSCEKCAKVFYRLDYYKVHQRSHLEENNFKCSLCPREFQYKSSFNRHLNSHSSSKAFVCSTCGKGFHRPDTLHVHAKLHDGGKPSKRVRKSEMFLTAGSDVVDPTPLLDCSVDISCEHRYSMETRKKAYRRGKAGKGSKTFASVKHNLETAFEDIGMHDLDSFHVGGKSDDSVGGDGALEPFDALGASDVLTVKRISPVPILMSMAESAAHFHSNPQTHMHRTSSNVEPSCRRGVKKVTKANRLKRASRKTKARAVGSLLGRDRYCLASSSPLLEAGAFIPLLPNSTVRRNLSVDIDTECCILDSASVVFSDSESQRSRSSDEMCINFDSDSNDSGESLTAPSPSENFEKCEFADDGVVCLS